MRTTLSIFALLAAFPGGVVAGEFTVGGGDLTRHFAGPCITPEQRTAVEAQVRAYESLYGPVQADPAQRGGPAAYRFYPQAGRFWGDVFPNNFVDLDNTAGIRDYDCTDYTYDGHHGIDSDIVTWNQKNLGVPIYAALDGTVTARDDGHFDEQTTLNPGNMPNYVVLDHGGGHQTWYFHMKNGSVAVNVSDVVKAGQQLGLTASSGYSTGPHLHFESRFGGTYYEPFTSTCNAGTSGWADQPAFDRSMYLRELNLTTDDLTVWDGPPVDTSRTGWFQTGLQPVRMWIVVQNMPASGTWRIRVRRPDTTIAVDSGTTAFGNPFYRWAYFYWTFNVNFNQTGTWMTELSINGNIVGDAPMEAVASLASAVNRAPGGITGLSFTPAAPEPDDAIRCTVDTDLILRDPDYDQVTYRYVWTVDSTIVRDVTIAAVSDMLPAGSGVAGDTVECTVTPTDGTDDGNPTNLSVVLGGAAEADRWQMFQ